MVYLAFVSLCCRAVQAGKGPAPRHKGAPVGELRDAAVRHLRGVLVTYAILTIQNPDMWGDEVSSWIFCLLVLFVSLLEVIGVVDGGGRGGGGGAVWQLVLMQSPGLSRIAGNETESIAR